jgi:hypothetical protein
MLKFLTRFFVLSFFWGIFTLHAQDSSTIKSPQEIHRALQIAEDEFKIAQNMFNPWYTGPIITSSAHTMPPGHFAYQPYVYYFNNYASFDEEGHSHKVEHHGQTVEWDNVFVFGIYDRISGSVNLKFFDKYKNKQNYFNIGNLSTSITFGLMKETTNSPALSLGIREIFPTGKYQKLNPHKLGVDAIGTGSFATNLSLNISKIVWWQASHPMAFRGSLNYVIGSGVDVKGFNSYGGGYGCKGRVHHMDGFEIDFGYEFSFTQHWVLAIDSVYFWASKVTFTGYPGRLEEGTISSVGGPFGDQFSLAPAIEYNFSSDLGLLFGVWFSCWGRNVPNFASGVFSVTYSW